LSPKVNGPLLFINQWEQTLSFGAGGQALPSDGRAGRGLTKDQGQPTGQFRDQIRHPDLRRLYDYWESRRAGRRYPARADIDPIEFSFALGNVTLIEVLYDPLRFKFRLMGSLMAQRVGRDLTGQMVDDLPNPGYRDLLLAAYRKAIETGQPNTAMYEQIIEGRPRQFEVLRLPLAQDGEKINMLLLCPMFFEPLPNWPPLRTLPPGTVGPPRQVGE
jgi:hypothetical protein